MNEDDVWEGRMNTYMEEAERQVTALRAALDQERADNERLRAFAEAVDWGARGRYGQVLKSRQWIRLKMIRHGLMEEDGRRTALLSGRGEGGG